MQKETFPVLIVGGAGCGLTSAILLSDLGVRSLVVERHPETAHLPKAHYLNQRTMEIFRAHGLADVVYERGSPAENMGQVQWLTSLGGDGPLDRKMLHRVDAFGGGELEETYLRDSPTRSGNLPQMLLEPILRERAEARDLADVRFSHELTDFIEDSYGIVATILNRDTGEKYEVRARYIVGADGGRTLGPRLGVKLEGPTNMVDMVAVHIEADLAQYLPDDAPMLRFIINPESSEWTRSASLVPVGPRRWDRHSENWSMYFGLPPGHDARTDEDAMAPHIRALLKLPDLELEIRRISHWIIERVVADHYRVGRVLLAGDAAHRHPPHTGLGLNTAVQDAHNLAWKLAAVLRGEAPDELLDSYETERRPIGLRNAGWAFMAFQNHGIIDAAIGLVPGAPMEYNIDAFSRLFEDSLEGATRRQRLAEAIGTQRVEHRAHGIELGFSYEHGAIVPDGTPKPVEEPMGTRYHPTTRPGHRLPHAWVRRNGELVSTHDLIVPGRFLLISGTADHAWIQAGAAAAQQLGIALETVQIGPGDDAEDPDGHWRTVREIGDDGAILVRPDGHVGWRTMRRGDDGANELNRALTSLLARYHYRNAENQET